MLDRTCWQGRPAEPARDVTSGTISPWAGQLVAERHEQYVFDALARAGHVDFASRLESTDLEPASATLRDRPAHVRLPAAGIASVVFPSRSRPII